MTKTLVLQSHRQPLPYTWLKTCIDSVKHWADLNHYEYQFIDDALFDYVPNELLLKTQSQPVIATDLARLKLLQNKLKEKYHTVIWCDADFLIFSPKNFTLTKDTYSLGREVWIQTDSKNPKNFIAKIKVHNAFMMYRQNNPFLDFYADTATRLVKLNIGRMPPQFVGPKLLGAIHNIAQCNVQESAGMLSPAVIKDIANKSGDALALFKKKSSHPIAAANLCSSLFSRNEINEEQIKQCIKNITACIA
ncbi:MAG: hypothetical protein AB8C40_06920 [Gammaproteobacteria bacterium]